MKPRSHAVPSGYSMQLHAAVARQPVTVAIGTKDSRGFQHYSGGVFDGYCPTHPDHGVTVVGYAGGFHDQASYWLAKNSFGTSWGQGGYIRMARNHDNGAGQCGIQLYPSYPIKKPTNPVIRSEPSGEIPNSKMSRLHLDVPGVMRLVDSIKQTSSGDAVLEGGM